MSEPSESQVASGGRAATRGGRPPLVAVAGLCLSIAGLLLYDSVNLLIHTEYELSLYWPWLWPASVFVGVAGFALSTAGLVQSLRRGAALMVAVVGMAAGLTSTVMSVGPIAAFFVLTLMFGA